MLCIIVIIIIDIMIIIIISIIIVYIYIHTYIYYLFTFPEGGAEARARCAPRLDAPEGRRPDGTPRYSSLYTYPLTCNIPMFCIVGYSILYYRL